MARRLFCFVNKPPVDLRVCAVITGSLPTADAAFDPERKSLELVLRLGDDIRYGLTDTVPTIITDEDLTKLRVDNAMDLEMQKPMNLIHGQHVFRVAGFNMVLSDEGAAAYLENGVGTTFPLVVDEVVSSSCSRRTRRSSFRRTTTSWW